MALAVELTAGVALDVTKQSVGTFMVAVGLLHVFPGVLLRVRPELAGTLFGRSPLHNSLSGLGVAGLGLLMLHVVTRPAEILLAIASVFGMATGTAVLLRERRQIPARE